MAEDTLDVAAIAARIHTLQLNWIAEENHLTILPLAERLLRLGATPPPHVDTLQLRETTALAQVHVIPAVGAAVAAAAAAAYPGAYDARAHGLVTAVKDQGGCGSCVAFGTTATVETAVRVAYGNANLAVDLSEAQVFYCYGKAAGATCGSGWWPDGAFNGYEKGVVDEACFPYTAGDQNCNLCSNAADRETMISKWHTMSSTSDMKAWISAHGAATTCFTVYNDFFGYASGVYSPDTASGVAGGHCVSVVGYNDAGKYWICKNSWSSSWGEQGFFCIAYGTCGIDAEMWAVDGVVDTGWRNGQAVKGIWTIDQDFNAWADLADYGWKRITTSPDDVFYNMLSQLLAAKAAGHTVSVHLTNSIIDQIYS